MTFVFPVLLGGLALVGIPILIHLVMRQKPRTLKFPAFRFLAQRSRTNLRKLRLRHLLLLLLRVGLLALAALALARPKVLSERLNLRADRPVAAVLVFDTSSSMEYQVTGGRSRLDDAKQRGLEMLDRLPEGSRVAVLDTAEGVVSTRGEWLASPAQARQRVNGLKPRPDSAAVTARLADAYRLFAGLADDTAGEAGRHLPRLLCVFSDATRASWDGTQVKALHELADALPPPLERLRAIEPDAGNRTDLLRQLRDKLPPATGQDYPEQTVIDLWQQFREQVPSAAPEDYPRPELARVLTKLRGGTRDLLDAVRARDPEGLSDAAKEYRERLLQSLGETLNDLRGAYGVFIDVGVPEPADLAVVSLELPGGASGGGAERQLFAPGETVVLKAVLQATGADFESSLVCEAGPGVQKQAVALKKGERAVVPFVLDGKALEPGPQQVQVRLTGKDQLDCNNRRYVTFATRAPRDVLVIADAPPAAALWKQAVEAREDARLRCTVKTAAEAAELSPVALGRYRAVHLLAVKKPGPKLWSLLQGYVSQGGGLAVLPGGADTDLPSYNDDPAARALLPATLRKVAGPKEPGVPWDWDDDAVYKHPLFRPVTEWKQRGQDDFIQVPRRAAYYWEVEPNKSAAVLVRHAEAGRPPALLENAAAGGRVLLLTSRVDRGQQPAWNNYMQADTSFLVVLPGLLTDYLTGDAESAQFNFLSGRGAPRVPLPPEAKGQLFTLYGPGRVDSLPRPTGVNELTVKEAVTPGHYRVEDGERQTAGAFSVNLPAEESVLERVPVADVEDVLGRGAGVPLDRDADLGTGLHGIMAEPYELLPWLLLALLVLLALENLLGNLFYRRETT